MQDINLTSAHLHGANLELVNIQRGNLTDAILKGANVSRSYLGQTRLFGTVLHQTSIELSDFHLARFAGTVLGRMDLRTVKNLESVHHDASSIVDFETLALSWPLPLRLLRAIGLPDVYIDYLPSLLGQPIHFHSCFISYSSHDREFAERLHADLQNAGVRCWFAPHDIRGGQKLYQQVEQAIHLHDKLLLLLSERSMDSDWVRTEISLARKREKAERRRILFPLAIVAHSRIEAWECFDADIGKDSAKEIREYYIPSFVNWKQHDEYRAEFQKLLRDLRQASPRSTASDA